MLGAKVLIERWRKHYNTVRPHSSLGYQPPAPEANDRDWIAQEGKAQLKHWSRYSGQVSTIPASMEFFLRGYERGTRHSYVPKNTEF